MQVSQKSGKALLSLIAVALLLAAPEVFAKKDLFGDDPGSKQAPHTEQLVASSSSSVSSESIHNQNAEHTIDNKEKEAAEAKPKAKPKAKGAEKPPSYLEQQFSRFKSNLAEAKDDLFGNNKKSTKKEAASVPQPTETLNGENANSSEEIKVPTISATEAAQRAQALAEGQVINVRKYVEEDKPRYAVKLLQKNGRMKTINLDAVSGTLIEDLPLEATPQ